MTMITTFSSDEETEARIDVERRRLEELLSGSRVTRSSTIRVLIARGSAAVEQAA